VIDREFLSLVIMWTRVGGYLATAGCWQRGGFEPGGGWMYGCSLLDVYGLSSEAGESGMFTRTAIGVCFLARIRGK
jgi:hypothetical protein